MASVTVESLQLLNNFAVLKFHVGAFLLGDGTAAIPDPATIIDVDGKVTIPVGYVSGGLVVTDGLTITPTVSVQKEPAWQTLSPVRTDLTEDSLQLGVKFKETSVVTEALDNAATLAAVAASFVPAGYSTKRTVGADQPQRRVILVARDTKYSVTQVRVYPSVSLASREALSLQRQNAFEHGYTFDVLYDAEFGSDQGVAFNGPGWSRVVGS